MSNLFPSFSENDKSSNLDKIKEGSLFHSIEYELSGIVNKINNINNLDDQEIRNIIVNQHQMILNYDLFLMSDETRAQAQTLFTNKRFLLNFLNVVRILNLDQHEQICINKLAYDAVESKLDSEISDLLYNLTTEVNGREVTVLSGIIGLENAKMLSMVKNSTFKIEKSVRRVNTFLVKLNYKLTVKNIVDIYCFLYERFTNVFIYTMMEAKPSNLTDFQNAQFDTISIAMLDILNSLPSYDMKKLLCDYGFTIKMVRNDITVRFALKTALGYPRIIKTTFTFMLRN